MASKLEARPEPEELRQRGLITSHHDGTGRVSARLHGAAADLERAMKRDALPVKRFVRNNT